jgi:hypothetical protein
MLLLEIGYLNAPVWQTEVSSFINFGGRQGHRRHPMRVFFSGQAVSDQRIGKNHDNPRGYGSGYKI